MRKQKIAVTPYPNIGHTKFIAKLRPLLSARGLEAIETAYVLAKYAHRGQWRDDGKTRYFEHPKAVALILTDELQITEWETIVMGLLHDTPEDSFIMSWERLERNFGQKVVRGLKLVTKQPKYGYIKRLREYGDARVLMVKLADRLHNLRTLGSCSRHKQRECIIETVGHYLPLAVLLIEKLGPKHRWRGEYLKNQVYEICEQYWVRLRLDGGIL